MDIPGYVVTYLRDTSSLELPDHFHIYLSWGESGGDSVLVIIYVGYPCISHGI